MSIDLYELNAMTIIIRMFLAVLIGGLVGVERGLQNRTAGLRTYILVCLGSALVMMTNQYITDHLQAGGDPTRMGAQVISGIGFLGAGTIIVTSRNRVTGLTTAAGLWAAACVGLAIGIGFYEGAIAGGIAILAVMTLLRPLKRVIEGRTHKVNCYVIADSLLSFNRFLELCASLRVNILELQIDNDATIDSNAESELIYFVSIDLDNHITKEDFLFKARKISGINYIEDLEGE